MLSILKGEAERVVHCKEGGGIVDQGGLHPPDFVAAPLCTGSDGNTSLVKALVNKLEQNIKDPLTSNSSFAALTT